MEVVIDFDLIMLCLLNIAIFLLMVLVLTYPGSP